MTVPINLTRDLKDSNDDGVVNSTNGLSNREVDQAVFRRALLKLDLFLLPAVTFIYFLNFLDR